MNKDLVDRISENVDCLNKFQSDLDTARKIINEYGSKQHDTFAIYNITHRCDELHKTIANDIEAFIHEASPELLLEICLTQIDADESHEILARETLIKERRREIDKLADNPSAEFVNALAVKYRDKLSKYSDKQHCYGHTYRLYSKYPNDEDVLGFFEELIIVEIEKLITVDRHHIMDTFRELFGYSNRCFTRVEGEETKMFLLADIIKELSE